MGLENDLHPPEPAEGKVDPRLILRCKMPAVSLLAFLLLPAGVGLLGYWFQEAFLFSDYQQGMLHLLYRGINAFPNALNMVLLLHLLVWLLWIPARPGKWPLGLLMLVILNVSAFVPELWAHIKYGNEISLAQFGPVIVVMSLANDAAHFLLLAAAGSFVCFQFRDLTIPENEAHDVTTRPVWSIRGMFGATLVSAVILATLMWLRQLYSRTEAADFYPETDVGYIAWIVSNLLCSVTVLLAAATRRAGASVLLVGLWIITAVAIAVLGTLIWQLFLPSELRDSPSPYLVETLSGVAWMYLLHGQAFRFWNWNGYSLVRVRRDKNRLA